MDESRKIEENYNKKTGAKANGFNDNGAEKSGRNFRACIVVLFILFALVCIVTEHNERETDSTFAEGVVTIYENGEKTDTYTTNIGTIVIDAGHGGEDPGKVSRNGTEEKNINLSIALKLKPLLEAEGYNVVLTRDSDVSICTGDYGKIEDLANRVDIISDSEAALVISIHQNSYSDSSVHGAQVFYSKGSEAGKKLAEFVQESLLEVEPDNKRKPKADASYYLFVHTECPVVIAECGFLSNPEDESRLLDENYQQSMAEAIRNGVRLYQKSFQK